MTAVNIVVAFAFAFVAWVSFKLGVWYARNRKEPK